MKIFILDKFGYVQNVVKLKKNKTMITFIIGFVVGYLVGRMDKKFDW